ncbi:MAG: HAD family hydrolase [Oceanipulchritudo sp.]
MKIEGLLLDMDGLLIDTERVAERCWAEAERETGFRMPHGFYFTLIGQSMGLIKDRLVPVMDPGCDIDAFIAAANRIYLKTLMEEKVPLKPGVVEFLEYLDRRRIPRCLATSTFSELCRHKLESTGLAQWIPLRVCGNEVEHSKPAPDIYLEAARRLGKPPARLLVLEDSENGLKAALAAGCKVAHVPDLGPVRLDVQMRVDRIYRGLPEVRAAMENGEITVS